MSTKFFILLLIVCLAVLGGASFLLKQKEGCRTIGQGTVQIEIFYSDTCPICAQARGFLADLVDKYPVIQVKECEVSNEAVVRELIRYYQRYEVPRDSFGAVPVIFTKEKYFVGFNEAIAKELENCILECARLDLSEAGEIAPESDQNKISLPLIGQIDTAKYSLPLMAVVLGFFDGFNVCSLGALVLILGLVLALRDRRKILLFGGIFIVVTALVYGLLIFLWYGIFDALTPHIKTMEIFIGLLGAAGGLYFLKEFLRFKKQGPTCQIEPNKGVVAKFSEKLKNNLQNKKGVLVIMTTVLVFAVVMTVAEFPCSAAVPLFFAGRLAAADLSLINYLLYIAIFILFYLIDEIIVFLIAVFTMTIKLASRKFIVWLTLVEAVVLFLLGLYYLFGFLII